MKDELQVAIATFVAPYIDQPYVILNIAAAVEELSAAFPGVDRDKIADALRHYATWQGVTMLLNPIRRNGVSPDRLVTDRKLRRVLADS